MLYRIGMVVLAAGHLSWGEASEATTGFRGIVLEFRHLSIQEGGNFRASPLRAGLSVSVGLGHVVRTPQIRGK